MEENGYETVNELRGQALKHVVPNSELDYEIGPPAKINEELCRGCGICAKIAFCRAISMQTGKAAVKPEMCECCGLCASLCPVNAISF